MTLKTVALFNIKFRFSQRNRGGGVVLGKIPVPGRPTNLDHSRTRTFCICCLDVYTLIYHFSSVSISLGDGPTWT